MVGGRHEDQGLGQLRLIHLSYPCADADKREPAAGASWRGPARRSASAAFKRGGHPPTSTQDLSAILDRRWAVTGTLTVNIY